MAGKLSEIEEYFLMDAEETIKVLSNLNSNPESFTDEQIDTYEITVHGMKSALANIGEPELSAIALKLEKASKEKNFAVISEETPEFINALRAIIRKLETKAQEESAEEKAFTEELAGMLSEDEKKYLLEKLKSVKTACDELKKDDAMSLLEDLMQKTWPESISDFLDEVNVQLLHTAFKKAASAVNDVIEKLS